MGLQRLPSAVVSSLRTDVTVTTLSQCVTELVLNSIDAGATSIAVRVDLKNFRIQVVDNGCGLPSSDLNVIGMRYMTSKCHSLLDLQTNLGHFGFRGEALSSISEICGTLTIVSRCQGSDETFCKVFTQGVPHKVGKSRQQRAACGTTITVADFLYNRPVRRARIKPSLDLEEVKMHMESTALINPHVSFSLRNDVNNEIIMQTQKTENIPTVFGTLFGESIATNLIAVKEVMSPFVVQGYISREAHPLKNLQFIYVNKRLLLKTKLHKLVNSLMSRSAILKSNNVPHVPISKEINHNVFLAFAPPKRDKHAIFVLNITCPHNEYDITLDPKKTLVEFCDWDCILSCFESLLRKFIEKEAEVYEENEKCFGSEPPRKVKTVIDEINELCRVKALGGNISSSTEESISTRDLSRAVHGLPATRHEVNLSPDPSVGCMPSTASSNLFSSVCFKKGAVCISSSAFTEKPYPSEGSSCCDKNPIAKCVSNSTQVGTSSSTPSKQQCTVEPYKSLFKKPQSQSTLSVEKGFLSDTIHFVEKFRKIPDEPQAGTPTCHSKLGASSPVNALANIKEIRRKKLLNNLNKFSFKKTCEKPVLPKVSSSKVLGLKTVRPRLSEVQTLDVSKREEQALFDRNTNEYKAVQTNFTPATLDHTFASQIATGTNSDFLESTVSKIENSFLKHKTSVPDSNISNFYERENVKGRGAVTSEDAQSVRSQCSSISIVHGNPEEVLPNDDMKSGFRHIMSVEEMIVTSYDVRDSQPVSPNSPDTLLHDDKFPSVASKATEKIPRIKTNHKASGCHDVFNDVHLEDRNKKIIPHFGIQCVTQPSSGINLVPDTNKERRVEDSSQGITQEFFNPTPVALKSQDLIVLKESKQIVLKKTLVDYDSSPSSSQETSASCEVLVADNSISPSKLKRKQDNQCVETLKKICLASENSLPVEFSEEDNDTILPAREVCIENKNPLFDKTSVEASVSMELSSPKSSSKGKHEAESEPLKHANDIQEISTQEMNKNEDFEWTEKFDDAGKPFYIHKMSGITTYRKPIKENQITFKFSERFSFLPKGMSPILNDKCTNERSTSPSMMHFKMEEDLSAVKWGKEQTEQKSDFWPFVDQLLSEADKFSTQGCSENQVSSAAVQDLSQSDIKVYSVVFPYTFTKDIFCNLRVLGQLDNKFIVTIVTLDSNRQVLVLFDQHAVHERIRVENLTEEYKEHDGAAIWKSAPVQPELPLQLSSIEVRILESYKERMERLGFSFAVIDPNTISIQRVPTCLLLRETREVTNRGVSVLRQHLESLIREQVDSLLNTRGVGTDHPSIIRNVISSEACRGAVKFGHSLTVADCQAFLHNLSSCKLPFQCAHGRPALVPIVDLSALKPKQQLPKLNFQKFKRYPRAS